MVLDDSLKAGTKIIEALGLHTEVLEFGITPNRADCLSFIGIAREVAAAYNLPLKEDKILQEIVSNNQAKIKVTIQAPEACYLYGGAIVDNVQIQKSPNSLRYLLHAHGTRSISNAVDMTNYILLAYGQPLHAFDIDLLEGNEIIVRTAKENEEIVTLDGQSRKLLASDLVISDSKKAVAIAGVMGGQNTEITDKTKRIFIECAVFNPIFVRKTSKRLALSSDSSFRYERGIDELNVHKVLPKAAKLMAELTGGQADFAYSFAISKAWTAPVIPFRLARAEALLGIKLENKNSQEVLISLGCKIENSTAEIWQVTAPSYRKDLLREVDLIEELARVYGMDRIAETLPKVAPLLERLSLVESEYSYLKRMKTWACGLGLSEVVNYSFVSSQELDKFGQSSAGRIEILNPLSEEQKVMRSVLAPSLMHNVRTNASQLTIKIFEVAKTFKADSSEETGVKENKSLALLLSGQKSELIFPKNNENDLLSYADIKGLVEQLIKHLHLDLTKLNYSLEQNNSFATFLLPCVAVDYNGQRLAHIGQIKSEIADFYNARKDIFYAELDLDLLRIIEQEAKVVFKPLAVYPAVRRDITIVADTSLQIQQVLDFIQKQKIANFEEVQLLDLYEPENKASKNLTFRLSFRHLERTLQDNEVDKEREKLCALLVQNLGVKI